MDLLQPIASLLSRLILAVLAGSLLAETISAQHFQDGNGKNSNRAAVTRANCHLSSIPLIPGSIASFEFEDAAPVAKIALIYSLNGTEQTQVPQCPGLFAPLDGAKVQGLTISDGFGDATFHVYIPAVGQGLPVWVQGLDLEYCTLSNALRAVMDGSFPEPYIDLKLTNDDVTVHFGDNGSLATTVNGNVSVSDSGVANGNASVQIPGLAAMNVTIADNSLSVVHGGTTLNLRSLINDTNVEIDGVLTPISSLIDQYVADVTSGNGVGNWHINSQLLLSIIALTSTPSWRANTVTTQYEAGAPLIWRKVSSITGAAGIYSMSSISCQVLMDVCGNHEAIHRGGVSLLTSALIASCFAYELDDAAKCYQYCNDIWN